MRIRFSWLLLCAAACGSNKPTPAGGGVITIIGTVDMVGATVIVEGTRGEFRRGGATDPAFAVIPVQAVPSGAPAVQIEMSTPCGLTPVASRVDVASRSPEMLKLRVYLTGRTPAVPYWIDAPPDAEVKIGASVVKGPKGEISRLDCGGPLDVSIGGKVVGQVDGQDGKPIFITSTADTCYRVSRVAYGEIPADAPPVILRGGSVHRLSEPLQFFLEAPPESVSAPEWSRGAHLTELQRSACP